MKLKKATKVAVKDGYDGYEYITITPDKLIVFSHTRIIDDNGFWIDDDRHHVKNSVHYSYTGSKGVQTLKVKLRKFDGKSFVISNNPKGEANHGGTISIMSQITGEDDCKIIKYTTSFCNKTDHFSKKHGRKTCQHRKPKSIEFNLPVLSFNAVKRVILKDIASDMNSPKWVRKLAYYELD
jgi:hypothetical protein